MRKQRQKGRITSVRTGDGPTVERKHHNGGIIKEVVDRDVNDKVLIERYKAVAECPLDAYLLRGKITEIQYRVGIKFRHAYFRAVLKIRVDDIGSGSHGSNFMAAIMPIHSERILNQAYHHLSRLQKDIVITVCGHDEWAYTTAKFKTLLRALDALARLWSFV